MTLVRQSEVVSEAREPEGHEEQMAGDSKMAESSAVDLSTLGGEGFGEISFDRHNGSVSSEGGAQTPEISVESPEASKEPALNGARDRTALTASPSSSINRGGIRTASSKFANLRAAFEQPNAPEAAADSVKRRLSSSDKSVDRMSERKQEYEGEISKLKDELEKEKEMRIAYEEKVTAMEEEMDELQSQLEGQEEEYQRSIAQLQNEAEARLNAMANEARSRTQDASNLQKQLVELKKSVSTSTRTSAQVSDSTFGQQMELLQHEVQNWVVNNFRRVKVELSAEELCMRIKLVTEAKQYERLKPIYEAFDSAIKLPIYQATVACFMMEIFEEPFLFGLQGQRDWGKRLKQAAEGLSSVFDASTYHRWRANTFDALRQVDGIKEPVDKSAAALAEMICITLKAITDIEDSDARLASLKTIVLRAISLAHLIRVQQSQYLFILPAPKDQFDPASMDDINEDFDGDAERTIRCATFPAIFKLSDEDGDLLDERNIVVEAKVICNETEG